MTVQALFQVNDILHRVYKGETTGVIVRLNPVYANREDHPNHHFWKATPTGSMEMQINNPSAFDAFVHGKKYLLTFEEME
jgi:hypothetical protein